eukprot:tig00000441_g718.t1
MEDDDSHLAHLCVAGLCVFASLLVGIGVAWRRYAPFIRLIHAHSPESAGLFMLSPDSLKTQSALDAKSK